MNSRPSADQAREPLARAKNTGSPPTPRNARTGEFTPPGMYLQASWNRLTGGLRAGGSGAKGRYLSSALAPLPIAAYHAAENPDAAHGRHARSTPAGDW